MGKAKYDVSDYTKVRLPQKRGEPFWMEFITFRGASVAALHRHLRTVARKYNPNFMISGNVFGGFGFGPSPTTPPATWRCWAREEDFIYSEMQEYLDAAPRKNEQGVRSPIAGAQVPRGRHARQAYRDLRHSRSAPHLPQPGREVPERHGADQHRGSRSQSRHLPRKTRDAAGSDRDVQLPRG